MEEFMIENIKNLNKVELHRHLDGSLEVDTRSKISGIDKEVLKRDMIS